MTLPDGKRSIIPDVPLDRRSPLESLMQFSTLIIGTVWPTAVVARSWNKLLNKNVQVYIEAYCCRAFLVGRIVLTLKHSFFMQLVTDEGSGW